MAAVHYRDPSKDFNLPSISEITSKLPLLPPQPISGDSPPLLALSCRPPFGGTPISLPSRAPAVIEKLERRVRSPVEDYGGYACATNPAGQLPSGQMPLWNGLVLPRSEHYNPPGPQTPAEPIPEADKQREAVPGLLYKIRALENIIVLHDIPEQRLVLALNEAIAISEDVTNYLKQRRDRGIMLHNPVNEVKNPTDKVKRRRRLKREAPLGLCQFCGTTYTPEWRRGPNGAGTLCNACGLAHAKERRSIARASNAF